MRLICTEGIEVFEFDPGPDYRGRVFSDFYVSTNPAHGPGWYVFGRNEARNVIKVCAQPNVTPRKHPHYNIRVRRGFKTMREAQACANFLNGMEQQHG